jgi:hypothetical protein
VSLWGLFPWTVLRGRTQEAWGMRNEALRVPGSGTSDTASSHKEPKWPSSSEVPTHSSQVNTILFCWSKLVSNKKSELGMVVYICNFNTQKAEATGSWVQGQSEIHSEFKASLGCAVGSSLKSRNFFPPRRIWFLQFIIDPTTLCLASVGFTYSGYLTCRNVHL